MKRRITREIRRGIERVIILLLLSVLCNHNFVFFRGDTICERKERKGKENCATCRETWKLTHCDFEGG